MTFAEKDRTLLAEAFRNICYPANILLIHQSVIDTAEVNHSHRQVQPNSPPSRNLYKI